MSVVKQSLFGQTKKNNYAYTYKKWILLLENISVKMTFSHQVCGNLILNGGIGQKVVNIFVKLCMAAI